MVTASFFISTFGVMIPFGIIFFTIDWIYSKIIQAFTGRGI